MAYGHLKYVVASTMVSTIIVTWLDTFLFGNSQANGSILIVKQGAHLVS